MLAADWMGRAMVAQAERLKGIAQGIAPERTGRYRWGVVQIEPSTGKHVVVFRRRKRAPRGRHTITPKGGAGFHVRARPIRGTAGALLWNDTPYARYLEYGTRYMRRQRILGRTIDIAASSR